MCQPECAFDYAHAAQYTASTDEAYIRLNRVLLWQKNNATRGLELVKLDVQSIKLIAFSDSLFANNKDFSS